jgi:hypothetical protein
MAFTFHFDHGHKVLLVRFGRALTKDGLDSLVAAARDFAASWGSCSGIIDFSAVEQVDLDVPYLRSFGASVRVMRGAQRILVAPQDHVFGVLRMYGLHQASLGDEPMVVRTLQEAFDLLGLKNPDFQPIPIGDGSGEAPRRPS